MRFVIINENRDSCGRLRVPYFIKLIRNFLVERGIYHSGDFKSYLESLGILKTPDWDLKATVIQNGSIALIEQHKRFSRISNLSANRRNA